MARPSATAPYSQSCLLHSRVPVVFELPSTLWLSSYPCKMVPLAAPGFRRQVFIFLCFFFFAFEVFSHNANKLPSAALFFILAVACCPARSTALVRPALASHARQAALQRWVECMLQRACRRAAARQIDPGGGRAVARQIDPRGESQLLHDPINNPQYCVLIIITAISEIN